MVRLGEKIIALTTQGINSGMIGISIRDPQVGQSVLAIPNGTGGTISVCPFNAYEGDEGVAFPLPCGCSVFLAGEPPNYLPSDWESGVSVSCQQGVPYTDGWECKETCPINPIFNPCARGDNSGWVNDRDYWFCRNTNAPRQYAYKFWQQNTTTHDPVYQVSCRTDCPAKCGLYPYSGTSIPLGCARPMQYLNRTEISPGYTTYGCTGRAGTCPNYAGGAGIKKCANSPPIFEPGNKPKSCKYPANLDFTGWFIPGGEGSVSSGSCVMSKATEGARTRTSVEDIRCKFS